MVHWPQSYRVGARVRKGSLASTIGLWLWLWSGLGLGSDVCQGEGVIG